MVGGSHFLRIKRQILEFTVRKIYVNTERNRWLGAITKRNFVTFSDILVANTFPQLRLCLIALLKNTSRNQVLQKHLIIYFCKNLMVVNLFKKFD